MTRFLSNRWLHVLILSGLLAGAVVVRMHDYDWIKALRFIAFDHYNRIMPRPRTDQAVIVDIDEESLGRPELGQWPWPRDVVAKLVDNLHAMGARAIVFDMVFAEADRTSPHALLDRLPEDLRNQPAAQQLASLPDHDEVFAQSIKNAGNVVTGFIWSTDRATTRRAPAVAAPVLMRKDAKILDQTVPPILGVATNLPVLAQAAAGNGCFGVQAEIDGIIREVPLLFRLLDENLKPVRIYPSLALEGLRVAQSAKIQTKVRGLDEKEINALSPPFRMRVGEYDIPLDYDGKMYVWYSPARPDKYIPAWKAVDGSLDPTAVAGKIVLVGTSAEGLKDIRSTPLNLFIPGVELHLNIIEQVLQKKFLLRPKILEGAELIFLAAIGFLVIILAPFVGAVTLTAFTAALVGGMAWASWAAFSQMGLLLDPVYPGLCIGMLHAVSSLLTYIRTELERRQVRQAFGLYISPDFMKELTSHPDKLRLGGETRELTLMFTDIRGFTTISESLTPEELTQLMNDFLTPMSDLVMNNRGTIDKYMGDAMMAFWNAPLDDPDHARHACSVALKMNGALAPINAALEKKALAANRPPLILNAGIGVNTGPASVGNMGSKQRFAYSALGDTVNLASRLESQTKAYGVNNLIGEGTRKHVQDFAALELDLLQVKGKTEPVRIFTLLGDEEYADTAEFREWAEKHRDMMAAYRTQDFEAARLLAREARKMSEGRLEVFYNMYLERIRDLKRTPPPRDWDGVFVAKSK